MLTRRLSLAVVSYLVVALYVSVSCAHQRQEDPPLYEDLLFAQIDKDKPKPGPEFPFDDLIIEDGVPVGNEKSNVELQRPQATDWRDYLIGSESESVGLPNSGKLVEGRLVEERGKGYFRKNDKAPYGTDETVAIILWAFERMASMYPATVDVVLGDLSAERGRRLKPHSSHQSGRDVDIGYYFKDNEYVRHFKNAHSDTMDIEKNWSLIELLLSTHQVQYLFIDRRLHRVLFEEAKLRGWDEEELKELFEAPVGNRNRSGIIRHQKGHRHHIHVRFKCDEADERCR